MSVTSKLAMLGAAGSAGGVGGSYVAYAGDSGVKILDHTTPGSLSLLSTVITQVRNCCAFSPSGSHLYVASGSSLYVYDVTDPSSPTWVTNIGGGTDIKYMAFSPDGNYLVTTGKYVNTTFSSYDVSDIENPVLLQNYTPPYGSDGNGISFTPDGSYFAVGSNSSPYVWLFDFSNPSSFSPQVATYNTGENAGKVDFSADGDYLLVANGNAYFTLLDHTTPGTLSLADSLSANARYAARFNPDNTYVVGGGYGSGNIVLAEVTAAGDLAASISDSYTTGGNFVRDVCFSPDGQYILAASISTSEVLLLDHTTPGSLSLSSSYNTGSAVYTAVFSPN